MTVSSLPCPACKRDRHFFALPHGKGIYCIACGHTVLNKPEPKYTTHWESANNRKARAK